MAEDSAPRIDRLLRDARAQLHGDEAAVEAEQLLCAALGRNRAWLFAHGSDPMPADALLQFNRWIEQRRHGVPVAHLLGRRGFWSLDLEVTPATLIPRPETERLVEAALARLPADRPLRIADLGTGSGAIALALAVERPNARVVATDASADALAVARRNAERNGLANVEFRHGHWFAPLADMQFELIASNPPYIASDDPHLRQGDLRHEPIGALASGRDGLDDLHAIIQAAPAHLADGGWLLLEHGWHQGAAVRSLLDARGFSRIDSLRDLEHRERVTVGLWQPRPSAR